ncbi:MAG: DUF6531 domain-containing protein, partial [Candidatus Aenigmatarchaeota archaeon]
MTLKRFLFIALFISIFTSSSVAYVNSVDPSTGYFIYSKTDLSIPGIIPVNITRYYQAGSTAIGAFGNGTYFEYDWLLLGYGADGNINNTNPTMFLLIKPGNYQYRFDIKQADGTFINDRDPAMAGAVVTKNSDSTRTLRMKDGWTYKFNSNGRLIEISDRNGNTLVLTRRSTFEGEFLTEIIMPDGRKITFNQTWVWSSENVSGFFRTDSIIEPAGRTIKYTYYAGTPGSFDPRLK